MMMRLRLLAQPAAKDLDGVRPGIPRCRSAAVIVIIPDQS